jgi:signal transduction histidine kinase
VSSPSPEARRGIRLAALRVPLIAKLVGANLLVVGLLTSAWLTVGGPLNGVVVAALGIVIGLHAALVLVALRPIRDLESVAARVWQGDYGARVERSSVADHEVLRVGSMFNILLDGLAADRAKLRVLAGQVIAAGDRERAALARELHDSVAQQLAAVLLQLAAAARDASEPLVVERLSGARDALGEALDEARALSHALHPGVLDDLGLEAAVRRLARDSSNGSGVDVDVHFAAGPDRLPRDVEGVLYRVAQEAMRNATAHASAHQVRVTLHRDAAAATLNVHDDGVGFDVVEADRRRLGLGLTTMRERVDLVNGRLDVNTAKGGGTTITATVPLDAAARVTQF